MKERLNQRAAAALVVLGLLAGSLSGCGQAQIGEKQAFSPNVTEQEQTQPGGATAPGAAENIG